MTVTETVDPGGTGGNPDSGAASYPSVSQTALDVDWENKFGEYQDKGLVIQFDCPPRGIIQPIYGDRLYDVYSSVCTAGVHDGRITVAKGGRLIVQVRESAYNYPVVRSNGITSQEHNSGGPSFEFLPPR